MKHLDLFSGIAGFAYGLEMAGGFETTGFCESDPFCRAVITKHYPGVKIFEDIHTLTADAVLAQCGRPAIITGGPPCQPSSVAGHRRGAADDRWLWPEFLRVVFALRPLYVLAENPRGVLSIEVEGERFSIWLARQFQSGGYELLPVKLAAEDVGAPHRRERIWFIGRRMEHTQSERRNGQVRDHQWEAVPKTVGAGSVANAERRERQRGRESGNLDYTPREAQRDCQQWQRMRNPAGDSCEAMADTISGGCDGRAPEPFRRPQERTAAERAGEERGVGQANASCRRQRANGSASGRGGHADECGEGVGHADSLESRLSQRSHEAGLRQQSPPERSRHLWPARPGEQQYEWEEPRLVKWEVGADSARLPGNVVRLARRRNRETLKAAGNSCIPQITEIIGRAILEMEEQK